ncbi:MAG: gliding motility-associated C-terminal domain-containing protein [Bacteroidota bacterium]
MQIKNYIFFILLCFSATVSSQNNTFYRKYNLGGMQGALQLAVTNDGGFIATGQHEGIGSHGDCDIYVYKLDVCGNIDWFKIYGESGQEGGKSIFQMNDGNYLVSGLYNNSSGGTFRAFNMKLDINGNVVWIKRYSFEWMMYADECANGDILSIGRNGGSLFIIRTNNLGNLIWSKQVTGFGDMGLWLDELPNGDIVFTSVNTGGVSKDFAVGKLTSAGNQIWMKAYGGNGFADIDHTMWSCKAVTDLTDNTLVVTTPTVMGGFGDENILVSKISIQDGSVIWAKVFGGPGRDQSRDITKYPGGFAIIGQTNSFPIPADPSQNIFESLGEKDILMFSVDESGVLSWAKTYGGSDRDKGIGLKYNNDNGFSISAFTTSPYFGNSDASFDPLFIKTDSVGFVGCQMGIPPLQSVTVALTALNTGNVQNATINVNTPSIAITDYSPTDQYQCQSCFTIPDFNISDTTVCVNDSVYIFNTTLVGLTCFQQWNVSGQFFDGDIDPVLSFSSPGVYTIYLYSTCGANSDTTVRNIYVVDPQINAPDFLCIDSPPADLQINIPGGIWGGNNVNVNGQFNPAGLSSGYNYISYNVPDYCVITDSIDIRPLPNVNAGNDTTFCFEADYILNGINNPNYSYLWSPNLYLSSNQISNPIFQYSNNQVTNVDFTYSLTVTDNLTTCSNSDNVELIIFSKPPINAGNDTLICDGSPYQLNATGANTYIWGNNEINGTQVTLGIGMNQLIVTGTDNNNCSLNDTIQVQVVTNPIINAGNDTLICIQDDILLNASSSSFSVNYVWNVNVSNLTNYIPPTIGINTLSVLGTDINGCVDQDTLVVLVHDVPTPNFTFLTDCYSTEVTFTNTTTWNNYFNDQLNLYWSNNGNIISTELNSFVYNFNSSGIHTIQLLAEGEQSNCKDSTTITIDVPTNPSIDFSFKQNCDYILEFMGEFPNNEVVLSIDWQNQGSVFSSNNLNPTLDLSDPGQYLISLTITNDYPCVYSVEKLINVSQEETLDLQNIPNVITANNDGINDEFDLDFIIDECLEYEFVIINRWGNVVFESGKNGPPFTGRDMNNSELLPGVYFYIIISEGQQIHGSITIIR